MVQTIKAGGNTVRWFGPAVTKKMQLTTKQRLKLAAESVANQVKRNISAGRPASKPGDFPHVDTGRLRQSIFWTMKTRTTVIVGTPLKYGLFLEIGTARMAARPYLRRTLNEHRARIERIFTM